MDVKYFDVIFSSYEYIIYDSNLLSMKNDAL